MMRQSSLTESITIPRLFDSVSDSSSTRSDDTLTSSLSLSIITSSWNDAVNDTSTERTSSYLFREDRFDRQAANDVRQMFEAIDIELYEDNASRKTDVAGANAKNSLGVVGRERFSTSLSTSSYYSSSTSGQRKYMENVGEWKTVFPHLRVCGISLKAAGDEGVQTYHFETTMASATAPTFGENHAHNFDNQSQERCRLGITGKTIDSVWQTTPVNYSASTGEEEVFERDGNMEEIIAIDCHKGKNVTPKPRNAGFVGMPPVTPLDCIHSNVTDSVFDEVWKMTVHTFRTLLQKHCRFESGILKSSMKHASNFQHEVSLDSHRPHSPLQDAPLFMGRLVSTPEKHPASRVRSREETQLSSLLRIQPKTLTLREKLDPNILPHAVHVSASATTLSSVSASTSNLLFVQLTGNSPQTSDALSTLPRRIAIRDRLEAIHDDDCDSSISITAIAVQGQSLRGSRVSHLSSLSFLPPISSDSSQSTSGISSGSSFSNKTSFRRPTYRVNSALVPKAGRVLTLSERPITMPSSRPFTSETANARSNNRRHSATSAVNNMRNFCLLKSVIGPAVGQPQVRGIGLQRYHTVIS